jgi:hypothetical protein
MMWPAPVAQRWIVERRCDVCDTGQRSAPHEPCWSCGGPTVDGAIWPGDDDQAVDVVQPVTP